MRLFAIALSILVPAQAMALSCMRPTVEHSFNQAQNAKEHYVVVSGRLTFEQSKAKKPSYQSNNPPEFTRIPGKFTGMSLSKAGFVTPFERSVTIEMQCLGPWCGSATYGAEYLAFMKKTATGYTMNFEPCYSQVFQSPTPQMLDAATACLNGASCVSEY